MSKKKNVPAGWQTKPLGEVLGPVHGAKFAEIWNANHGDMTTVQKAFREYLQPFRAEFNAKGFDVDFLSYSVPYHVGEQMKGEQQQQAAQTANDVTNDIMSKQRPNPWN